MKASELVEKVSQLIEQNGDFTIGVKDWIEGKDYMASIIVISKKKDYEINIISEDGDHTTHEVHDSFIIA